MNLLRTLAIAAGVAALSALAACTENPQLVDGQHMGKTVTRDTQPWQGDPLLFQADYKRGDKASWEAELKQRLQGQNEYIRIGG